MFNELFRYWRQPYLGHEKDCTGIIAAALNDAAPASQDVERKNRRTAGTGSCYCRFMAGRLSASLRFARRTPCASVTSGQWKNAGAVSASAR